MITESDRFQTIGIGPYYVILPTAGWLTFERFCQHRLAERVPEGFAYHSGRNHDFLGVEEIRHLIRRHVNPDFVPK
jgi:hypothetical protein